MTIFDFIKIIKKYIIIIIVLPIISGLCAAFITTNYIEPTYSTYTTLYVLNKQNQENINYNDLTTSGLLIKDYREFALSNRVTKKVAEKYTLTNLNSFGIDVTTVNDTRLIKIIVTGHDPVLISDIANSLTEEFSSSIIDIMQVENVSVVDEAIVPQSPSGPNIRNNTLISFVLGLMLAAGIAFAIEFLNTSIKSIEDVENQLGLSVLAQIPIIDSLKGKDEKLHK